MTKELKTLVEDIYDLMKNRNVAKGVDIQQEIHNFGENMKDIFKKEFLPYTGPHKKSALRLSSVGQPDRKQWYAAKKFRGESIEPHTFIMFMYGHMIEEMVLSLVRMAGHTVTDEQKECMVSGVKGHMDCKIDGVTVDVKSTSSSNFNKFKYGTLAAQDDYGYIDQLKAYAHSEGERKFAWLAMNKTTGHLCVLEYDLDNKDDPMYEFYSEDIEEKIEHVKKSVKQEEKPPVCYPLDVIGKSGNTKLSRNCGFCQYKRLCYPDLKEYEYKHGKEYLVDIVKEPRVPQAAPLIKDDKGF